MVYFSEQEILLLAELGRGFLDVESKHYDGKTLAKKTKAWDEILTRFNSQILMASNVTSFSFKVKDAGGGPWGGPIFVHCERGIRIKEEGLKAERMETNAPMR